MFGAVRIFKSLRKPWGVLCQKLKRFFLNFKAPAVTRCVERLVPILLSMQHGKEKDQSEHIAAQAARWGGE